MTKGREWGRNNVGLLLPICASPHLPPAVSPALPAVALGPLCFGHRPLPNPLSLPTPCSSSSTLPGCLHPILSALPGVLGLNLADLELDLGQDQSKGILAAHPGE